ncbi:MAG TPA: nucleoside monophosphate kinase [Patescibacteria group bacterium]|nr:nucleoside monophosphate kinase [Patescibacteria group bacterium]
MTTQPINVILLGDPAAGKATQSELLVKKYGFYDLDMGKILRNLNEQGGEVSERLKATLDKGKLTPTDIVREIHKQACYNTPANQGILFDGNPKMLGEAKLVAKHLKAAHRKDPIVIYLSIPMAETIKRMTERTEYFAGKFSKRADDNAHALKERVKYYRKNISQVVAFFEKIYPFKKVSGLGTVAEVHARIVDFITNHS